MAEQMKKSVGFNTVQLFKDKTLGIGSYGKVCKAKCDDLLCAAKLIHETLFDPTAQQLIAPQGEHRLPMKRFEQECEFLSTIRHPNIIQYLGIYQDPDTGLPALLMELMDDSLTHFLETSTQPIPYHIQVNICHDITLALSFLHSNDIVHRDLSSNNVLLIGNIRAKVTDFGMARLGDQNPRATHLTFTMCPGTDVYMPPEAVQDDPVYTEKIDCFSFGVIMLQILTRQFPKPGNRRKRIEISHPGLPRGTMAEVPIPETERRQNHISKIDPNHPLLQVALDCLKDRDVERPSSHQLCERVAALKDSPGYSESVRTTREGSTSEQGGGGERDRELRSLRQEHAHQVQSLQEIIQSQTRHLEEKEEASVKKDQTIIQNKEEIARLERELGRVNQQLEQLRQAEDATSRRKQQSRSGVWINLWRKGVNALCKMSSRYNAVANDTALYVRTHHTHIYAYTASTSTWSQLPNSPTRDCPPVIINNLLTLVGGYHKGWLSGSPTNQLFSLTGEGSGRRWTEEFPPIPTKRCGVTALCTGSALIVAGGIGEDGNALQTVEVMYTETLQWSTATDLPQPVSHAPGAVCGDHVYILALDGQSKSMYTCSVSALLQSCLSRFTAGATIWYQVAAPPLTSTTCVSIHGRLLTIGGKDLNGTNTAAVHMYYPTTDSWEVISHMALPRYNCFSAVLPNSQLMVVGGKTFYGEIDSVEWLVYITELMPTLCSENGCVK